MIDDFGDEIIACADLRWARRHSMPLVTKHNLPPKVFQASGLDTPVIVLTWLPRNINFIPVNIEANVVRHQDKDTRRSFTKCKI